MSMSIRQKRKCAFGSQDKIFSFVQRSARKALLAYSPVPNIASSLWGTTRTVPTEQPRNAGLDWAIGHDEQIPVSSDQLSVSSQESEVVNRESGVGSRESSDR